MCIETNFYSNFNDFKENSKFNNKKILILITENTFFDFDYLNSLKLEYYGAVFPKVIYKNKLYDDGIVVYELDSFTKIEFIKDMSNFNLPRKKCCNFKTIITIVDGFSDYNIDFLENLYECVNLDANIIGGGAGLFKNSSKPMLFSNDGLFKDSAILVFLENRINIAVGLGWETFKGPYLATKCEGKQLVAIDYQNAVNLYCDALNIDEKYFKKNFYDIVKKYPLGIIKHDADFVVRDIIDLNSKNQIVLAGDIEENTLFNILKGDAKNIFDSTSLACKTARIDESCYTMVFDCISRLDFLGEEYSSQTKILSNNSLNENIFGAVCVGEIANDGKKYINFLNKSCVIGGVCH